MPSRLFSGFFGTKLPNTIKPFSKPLERIIVIGCRYPAPAGARSYSLHVGSPISIPKRPSAFHGVHNITFVGQSFLELCHSVPVDTRKDLNTSSQQKQEKLLAICKRIEQLGGELPMNWLDCELIYLERFAHKLQRILDRQVIGF